MLAFIENLDIMRLSLADTNSMKGVAIIFIVFHNLLHWLTPVQENEFVWSEENGQLFIEHLKTWDTTFWVDIFSYIGWYGIIIFLFVSGYGLVRKYEKEQQRVSFMAFVGSHARKLFALMLLPYLIYLTIVYFYGASLDFGNVFFQITMLSNICNKNIDPGVYWYFGLMLELYTFYYIFFYRRSNPPLIFWNALSIVIMIVVIILADTSFLSRFVNNSDNLLSYIRHNFIGWLLPFTIGVVVARYNLNISIKNPWLNLLLIVIGVILLVLSNQNIYAWLFSPILAILMALLFNKICTGLPMLNKCFIWFGKMSAFLFVVHPLVRYVYKNTINSSDFFLVMLYFAVSVLLATGYSRMYSLAYEKLSV